MEFLNALMSLLALILSMTPDEARFAFFDAVPQAAEAIEALEPTFRFIFHEDYTISFETVDN